MAIFYSYLVGQIPLNCADLSSGLRFNGEIQLLPMIFALQLILLILMAASVVFYLWCAIATDQFFTSLKQEISTNFEQVSAMIPVCDVNDDSREDWESFCQQDYEYYKMLFGIMNPLDPAIPTLKEVVAKFPRRLSSSSAWK